LSRNASADNRLWNRRYQLRGLLGRETGGHAFSMQPLSQRTFLSYDSREDVVDKHEG
jgi:hypothetical protein